MQHREILRSFPGAVNYGAEGLTIQRVPLHGLESDQRAPSCILSPMTHQELATTTPGVKPGKRRQRVWLAGSLAVAVAGIAVAATLVFWHPGGEPGGDPGGVRQQMLRSISVAVPSNAKIQAHTAGGPTWDTCGGKPGTPWGWTDVIEDYQFTSAHSAATVVAGGKASMRGAGWKLVSTSATPLGPVVVWTKTAPGNVVAEATLSVGTRGPDRHSPSYWTLTGSAPPEGVRASGC